MKKYGKGLALSTTIKPRSDMSIPDDFRNSVTGKTPEYTTENILEK